MTVLDEEKTLNNEKVIVNEDGTQNKELKDV
jgi:hypothetical protein